MSGPWAGWLVVAGITAMTVLPAPRELSAADVQAGRRKAEPCAICHGRDGNSTSPTIPSLAGQRAIYLHWQLILYRDQRRKDPQMSPFAANLSDADMADLAAYYETRTPVKPSTVPNDPQKLAAGERLAEIHHCVSCHAPRAQGERYPPRLTGLHYDYLVAQLRGFRAQTRAELDGTMTSAARPLSEEDIENLAHYLANLPLTP